MENKISTKDIFITGFALFAMFLGAGNLIFPPYIGINAGRLYPIAMLGFLFTGIAMPLLGIVASGNTNGSMLSFTGVVSKKFAIIFNVLILICIGPFLAIPRTAATTYEIGIIPIFGDLEWGTLFGIPISRIVVSAIYFTTTYLFVRKPSKVIDIVGKYFTPALLVLLVGLIVKGTIDPIGTPGEPLVDNAFSLGFKEGYQTMDALGSFAMAGIAIMAIKSHISDEEAIRKATRKAALVAALGLFVVYGGFIYLGATGSIEFRDIARTDATVKLVEAIGSNIGKVVLSISMCFACLTTAIGLTTTISNTFYEMSKGKIPYNVTLTSIILLSFVLSVFGVNKIISIAEPILNTLYPSAIVLILLNLFRRQMKRRTIFIGGAYGALIIGLLYGISSINPDPTFFVNKWLAFLPLGKAGFAWIFTAITGMILAVILDKTVLKDRKSLDMASLDKILG